MKYTVNRHNQIVEMDIDKMSKEDLIIYASLRPIWNTREEAEREIKPIEVRTGTGKNDLYYI